MIVLKAIGRFFAKIGRWIRDTAWVQPLLIVGAIFAIILSIPKIVGLAKSVNKEDNAAQAFFKKGEIDSQGDDLSKGSDLDKFFSILDEDDLSMDQAFNKVNDLLKLENNKTFFLLFVDSTTTCNDLYNGLKYLKNNWDNDEFKNELNGTSFAYRTVYIDKTDEDDSSKNLLEDCYDRYRGFFEDFSVNLYNTNFATNKDLDDKDYYAPIGSGYTGFSAGTIAMFNFNAEVNGQANETGIYGLRNLAFLSDISGSGEYAKAQTLYHMWTELDKYVFGNPDSYVA